MNLQEDKDIFIKSLTDMGFKFLKMNVSKKVMAFLSQDLAGKYEVKIFYGDGHGFHTLKVVVGGKKETLLKVPGYVNPDTILPIIERESGIIV